MNIQVIIKSQFYPRDHAINTFGDYKRIAVQYSRKTPTGKRLPKTTKKYFLLPHDPAHKPKRITEKQFLTACELLFYNSSYTGRYYGPEKKFPGVSGLLITELPPS